MKPLRQILVPVDFSPGSEEALLAALGLASKLDASTVTVLHVREAESFMGPEFPSSPHLITDPLCATEARETAVSEVDLQRFIARLTNQERRDLSALERTGEPSKVIVEVAAELRADLIVMGTHGRTGFSHLLLGSVAERVVRHAPCAVLTIRTGADRAAA
jgi:universal stress protein A